MSCIMAGLCGGGGVLVIKSCLTLITPWTVARQAPLSMGFPRQEYGSGLPFPSSKFQVISFPPGVHDSLHFFPFISLFFDHAQWHMGS